MKKIFLLSFLSAFFLTGCMEAPMRYRAPKSSLTAPDEQNPITSPGTTSGATSGSGSTTGTTTGGTTTEPGFESCNLDYKYHTVDIGSFGLCQNKYNPAMIKARFSQTSPETRICFVPTTKSADGSSTYIGNPQCTLVDTSGKIFLGEIPNNRPGYQNSPINGVMVMKEPLLAGFISCMHSVSNWPNNVCPNGPQTSNTCYTYFAQCPAGAGTNTYSQCYSWAMNYKDYVCNDFKNRYKNSYADIRLY